MKLSRLFTLSAAGLLAACTHTVTTTERQVVVDPAPAPPQVVERVTVVPPPAPIETRPASPYGDAIWVPGHWNSTGTGWMWIRGHWE